MSIWGKLKRSVAEIAGISAEGGSPAEGGQGAFGGKVVPAADVIEAAKMPRAPLARKVARGALGMPARVI